MQSPDRDSLHRTTSAATPRSRPPDTRRAAMREALQCLGAAFYALSCALYLVLRYVVAGKPRARSGRS